MSSSSSSQPRQVCRNVTVGGRRTSVRMEPVMWTALEEVAEREAQPLKAIFALVDGRRGATGLTAALRIFIISYFRCAAGLRAFSMAAGEARRPAKLGLAEDAAAAASAPGAAAASPLVRAALAVLGSPSPR